MKGTSKGEATTHTPNDAWRKWYTVKNTVNLPNEGFNNKYSTIL